MRTPFFSRFYKGNSIQDIMSAILLTSGPISNYRSFVNAGPRHLRKIDKESYDVAAKNLEVSGLGKLVTVVVPIGGPKEVFVKKAPDEVCQAALESSCLCTMEEYCQRFHSHLPKKIAMSYREELVRRGYLTEEQIKKWVY